MLEVEGGDPESCVQILRHEVGPRDRQRLSVAPAADAPAAVRPSGDTEYPEYYTPKPYSKSFVQHLDHWYAQSHPDEDFAETFAVWLDPQSMWATRYAGWPAQRKLEYMDRLMRQLASTRPRVKSKRAGRSAAALEQDARRALPEEARALRPRSSRLLRKRPAQPVLRRAASTRRTRRRRASCSRIRKEVRSTVASFTDSYQYTIDQLLEKIIDRCRELNLRLTESEEATKIDFMVFLTVQTMNYLHSGRHRVAL